MRKLLPVLGVMATVGCSTKPAPTATSSTEPSPVRAGWQLVWQDEFNGSSIDQTKWSLEQNCWGGGNDELQCYTANLANASVQNGVLHIVAHRETFSGPAIHEDSADYLTLPAKTLPYTSARLRSKNKGDWRYGRFEIRARLPKGQGTWPAIWMLPTDQFYGTWPLSGEIDIMEAYSGGGPTPGSSQRFVLSGLNAGLAANIVGPAIDVTTRMTFLSLAPDLRTRLTTVYIAMMFAGGAIGSVAGTVVFEAFGWNGTALYALASCAGIAILSILAYRRYGDRTGQP